MESLPQVNDLLERLVRNKWFSNVGRHTDYIPLSGVPVYHLLSWSDANQFILRDHSESFLTALSNCIQRELVAGEPGGIWSKARGREYSAWVRDLKARLLVIATDATTATLLSDAAQAVYRIHLHSYLTKACIYYQFESRAVASVLIRDIIMILLEGNCVFGWDGEIPEGADPVINGRLVIY